jgi:hypothetical protein
MQRRFFGLGWISVFVAIVPVAVSAAPSTMKPADYARDVKPLLVERCYACHGNGSRQGGLQLDSREGVLKGGASGPAALAGKSGQSLMIRLVSGADPRRVMPARGQRLSPAEIALLKRWIDQGLKWDASGGAVAWQAPLLPRRPALPPSRPDAGITHPIDRLLDPYFRARRVSSRPLVDDRTFARRLYQDVIGLPPSPEELRAFRADRRPDKRVQLVRRLLADNRLYTEHWLSFWNDMLRNDYAGTGYIDGGRKPITDWLYDSLYTNKPYDRFVAELIRPTPESEGFIKGIVWRGVVNASQTPQMQAAQNLSQVFMGTNLKCASCHDSFVNAWKLKDAYSLAGVFAEGALEMVRCDRPTGEVAPIGFIYPQLGTIDPAAPREKRLEQLAGLLTSRENGRLTRTLVNRCWAKLMGRGLVEPTDAMDSRPWHPDLLDWLSADFADRGYDVKQLIETIATSRAYQLPAVPLASESPTAFVFTGPVVKRLSAEQFVDAVSSLTGAWQRPATGLQIARGRVRLPRGGKMAIVYSGRVMTSGAQEVDVNVAGAEALFLVATDGGNGANHDWADWAEPRLVGPAGEFPLTDLPWRFATAGYGQARIGRSIVEKPIRLGDRIYERGIGTHANSVIAYLLPPGVTRFRATVGPDAGALEEPGARPSVAFFVLTGERSTVEARAALATADPLMVALGRPNREQVVTQRPTAATTLQALALTNGRELADMLAVGAESWTARLGSEPARLVAALYEQALGRPPTPAERRLALDLLGNPARRDGVEDLLWALVMLPEFQLVN